MISFELERDPTNREQYHLFIDDNEQEINFTLKLSQIQLLDLTMQCTKAIKEIDQEYAEKRKQQALDQLEVIAKVAQEKGEEL